LTRKSPARGGLGAGLFEIALGGLDRVLLGLLDLLLGPLHDHRGIHSGPMPL